MALNIPGSVFGRPLQQNNRQTPTQAILGGRQAGAQMQQLDRDEQIRQLQAQIQQESTQPGFDPVRSQAVQQLTALDPRGAQDVAATFQALSKERKRAFFDDARKTNRLLKAGKIDDALKVIDSRLSEGDQLAAETGEAFDPSGTLEIQQSIMNGDVAGAISSLDLAEQGGVELGLLKDTRDLAGLTPRQKEFEQLKGIKDPEEKKLFGTLIGAIAKTASVEERAEIQRVVGDIKTVQDIKKASGKEVAKLAAQLKLQPEVRKAVVLAEQLAKAEGAKTEEDRSNSRALNVYNAAKQGLMGALGETTTGVAAGWIPALTSNQQIADGAIAAILPTIKSVFRSAGEGTFTDSDQKLLTDMIPTRKDSQASRLAKMKNIDLIINAKLGSQGDAPQAPQAPAQQSGLSPEEQAELDSLEAQFGGG